jgi:hypothetical protein
MTTPTPTLRRMALRRPLAIDKRTMMTTKARRMLSTSGDCGYDFQLGETYLVYADDEEGENYFLTSSCMRTKRLPEAGEDLAYLYFYKNQPEESSRIEGFATSD